MIIRVLLVLALLLMPVCTLYAAEGVSIGAVLPLSGKFATFGNKALQGAELAIERYNSTDAGKKRPVRLLIKDSQGLPEMAEKTVKELDGEGVSAIIGPLLGVTAETAAKKAQELGIPMITMTQKDGITGIGEGIFRNCVTNAGQVNALAEYAAREGIKKIAVLYPDNIYGKELNSLFASEAAKRGIRIVATQVYSEGQTDFGQEIKGLPGLGSPKKQKETVKPGFDAIFIPDYAERVGLILPQLAFYDVTDVRLLGTTGWNSPRLLSLAGDYMKNAFFVDGFFSGSGRPHVKDFVGVYWNTFGEEPGLLEALAYDTAGVIVSIAGQGKGSREEIRGGIDGTKGYKGVSGDISFEARDARRSYYLLTVREGRIEEVGTSEGITPLTNEPIIK
jgi:ABC-type branched-subunit amino acid transport system substrate-binding protein